MRLSYSSQQMFSNLLEISKCSQAQIRKLYEKEQHAVLKSLLKLELSNRLANHNQAITELKLAKSLIYEFMRSTSSKQDELIYKKACLAILSQLFSRLFISKRYREAMDYFKQISQYEFNPLLMRQILFNLFGLNSLLQIENYDVQNNLQFKYPSDTQISFYFIVSKVKIAAKKLQDAKLLLQKILIINKSNTVNKYLLNRVYCYLTQFSPAKYKSEYENLIKKSQPEDLFDKQQKQYSQQVLKVFLGLERKVQSNSFSQYKVREVPKLSKKMLCLYLKRIVKEEEQNLQKNINFNFVKSLIRQLQQQNNLTIIKQLVEETKIGQQAFKYFCQRFNNIQKTAKKYYFRKLLQGQKSATIPRLSQKTDRRSTVKTNQKQQKMKRNRTIPEDNDRANEILKKCILGSFLMKVNSGNNSVVKRFVRIQQKGLVWAENQKDIQFSSSICKWKHVKGLVYGKVSENLNRDRFRILQPWRCFSLITQDRSYDFYCDNQADIFFWLQGLSYQLQKFHQNSLSYPFYSKGRALWKMTLLKMGSKYNNPNKKYSSINAGRVLNYSQSLKLLK